VRAAEHAPRDPSCLLERCYGLAEMVERGTGVQVERQVWSQYLILHLMHRGASWASGAAQAAQFVRIIFGLEARLESNRRALLIGFFSPCNSQQKRVFSKS